MPSLAVRAVRHAAPWLLIFGLGLAGGCQRPGLERYVPAEDVARRALEAALDAWQAGMPAGPIDNADPPVQVVDAHRQEGQRLTHYEIIGLVGGDGPRTFTVRLVLEDPSQELRVRYYVVGISPLWVFRQEDYEMLAHWEDAMQPNPPSP